MFERLKKMLERFEELTQLISNPAIIADQARWQKLCKEHSDLTHPVELYKK